jgi:hypothetical protein
LFVLNGIAETSRCVLATFSRIASPLARACFRAGPLTVERALVREADAAEGLDFEPDRRFLLVAIESRRFCGVDRPRPRAA